MCGRFFCPCHKAMDLKSHFNICFSWVGFYELEHFKTVTYFSKKCRLTVDIFWVKQPIPIKAIKILCETFHLNNLRSFQAVAKIHPKVSGQKGRSLANCPLEFNH